MIAARRVLATVAVLAAVAPAHAIAATPPAAGARALAPEVARTLDDCLQRTHGLLVAFEIDSSGSLAVTDPEDRRVDAIGSALIGLERLAGNEAPARTNVSVLLGSFAGKAVPAPAQAQWLALDDGTLPGLLAAAQGYARQGWGRDTDYVLALDAAQEALDARGREIAAGGRPTPCKLLILVTDGGYELTDRAGQTELPATVPYAPGVQLADRGGPARAMAAGRRVLCQPGGLMDQLADDGVLKLVVALSNARVLHASDRAFLGALATGSDAGQSCGSRLSLATGTAIDIADDLDLFLVFDDLLGHRAPQSGIDTCSSPPCPGASRSFLVEPGIAGFVLDATAVTPEMTVAFTDPTGNTTTLGPSSPTHLTTAGTSIVQHWFQSRSVDVEAALDPVRHQSWSGRWSFSFVSPEPSAPPVYTLWLRSALWPRVIGEAVPTGSSAATVTVRLVEGASAKASDVALARSAHLRAQLTGGGRPLGLRTSRTAPGTFAVEVPNASFTRHRATRLELEVRFPTLGAPVERVLASTRLPALARLGSVHLLWLIVPGGALVFGAIVLLALTLKRRSEATKLPAPQRIRALLRSARIVPGTLVELTPDPGEPRFTDSDALREGGRDERVRRIPYKGFEFSAPPLRPFASAHAKITAADKRRLIAGTLDGPLPDDSDLRACLIPLELSGSWVFAVDRIDPEGQVHGQLLVLTAEWEDARHGARVLASARAALRAYDWEGFERAALEDDPFAWTPNDAALRGSAKNAVEAQMQNDDWDIPIFNGKTGTEL